MLTVLRKQVQGVLYAVPAKRKPALRRASVPDALFATDLPLVTEEDAVAAFVSDLTSLGWTVSLEKGWLNLDAPVPAPEDMLLPDLNGEWGCCISILQRHPGENGPAEGLIRRLVKAAEAGRRPFERECIWLHGELARMLRMHQPLPGALLPYLCRAAEICCK